jgi:regulator of sirC expression with transglutaminase-like and TPR domain
MFQRFLNEGLELHKQGNFKQALFHYNRLLNLNPFDETLLFLTADAYMREEHNGLAVNLLTNLIQHNPERSDAWCNLGTAYRKENFRDKAKYCWTKAIDLAGDTVEVCSNMASLYADAGQPTLALFWVQKALKCDPENIQAHWLKALALLTQAKWKAAWDAYSYRTKLENWDSRKTIEVPQWDGKPVNNLYIHGEQGVGDEIMFLSLINDAIPKAKKITLEVNKKVAEIVRQTWPDIHVVTTETKGDYDAKIPMGSLAALYRRNGKDFTGEPYLTPSPERVEHYRNELKKLGPTPYIGLTWLGGLKATRIEERSLPVTDLKPFQKYTCVSVQYEDTNPLLAKERESIGLHKINDLCVGGDLSEQAALFKALDAVVTVQQTAVHVAGAVGTPCYAMLNESPQWRYGLQDRMPWYKSVKLFRKDGEWPIYQVMEALDADLA